MFQVIFQLVVLFVFVFPVWRRVCMKIHSLRSVVGYHLLLMQAFSELVGVLLMKPEVSVQF